MKHGSDETTQTPWPLRIPQSSLIIRTGKLRQYRIQNKMYFTGRIPLSSPCHCQECIGEQGKEGGKAVSPALTYPTHEAFHRALRAGYDRIDGTDTIHCQILLS